MSPAQRPIRINPELTTVTYPKRHELGEWERQLTNQEWAQSTRTVVSRLTKALRACRARSKAKDAALRSALPFLEAEQREVDYEVLPLTTVRAALDKES